MINNMIPTMKSNIQLIKNEENNINGSKYKSSQVSNFRNIMTEAKNNIKSNASKKIYKKQENYGKDNNKLDSIKEAKDFNHIDIENVKAEEKADKLKNSKDINEPIHKDKPEISDENKDIKVQIKNILNLVDIILKDVEAINQESSGLISDQEITEMHLFLDKIKFNEKSNEFLSGSELDNMINKLKKILFADDKEFTSLPKNNSIMKPQLELKNLLNIIDEQGTKENGMINLMQDQMEVKKESYSNTKKQDLNKIVNSNKPGDHESKEEDINVKLTKENQNTEKVDEKGHVTEKTNAGKLIQKVLQKVVTEPKDSLNTDIKLDSIVKNETDKINVAHKPTSLYKMEILKQIVEKAQVLLGNDTSEMDMQLRPENLGKLSLKVVIEKGLMSAKFMAESQQVKEIIESNFNQLKDMLQKKGIDIQSFSVSVGQQNKDSNNNNGYRTWKESISSLGRTKALMNVEDDFVTLFSKAENPYEFHEGSIDYKA